MSSSSRIIESHTFCTGVDHPAFINVTLSHDHAAGIDEVTQTAGKSRCWLSINNEGITFFRNDKRVSDERLTFSAEYIPQRVRERLDRAGGPLDARDPSTPERAMQGAKDGSRVIRSDELVSGEFQADWLADEVMCDLFARAEHIAYGVHLESDVAPVQGSRDPDYGHL